MVIYINGNGYSCHCCRRTWTTTDTMDFESAEAAKAYAEAHNKLHEENDEHDSYITQMYPITGESFQF